MSFDFSTLITDRSQADLDALEALISVPMEDWTDEQLAEFNRAASKGAYNASDLNRVTACVGYLAGVFQGLGYAAPGYVQQSIPWAPDSVPTASQMAQYLANVQALQNAITGAYTVAPPSSMALLTYVGANDIEQLLAEINSYLTALQAVFLRSGMAWAVSGTPMWYFPDQKIPVFTAELLPVYTADKKRVYAR